jgi:predicted lipoprotein with Yx(FWY)xxD motif
MIRSPKTGDRPRRAARSIALVIIGIAGFAVVAVAGLAVAKTTRTTLQTARNSGLHQTIVVDSQGRTLYELSPETSRHLLCKSAPCLQFWPPLKVSKSARLTKSSAINGKLGKLHRNGFFQVTLDGRPLYRYAGDSRKGQAHGNGIKTFGGTRHVVKVKAAGGGKTTTNNTTTSSSSSYSYPGY